MRPVGTFDTNILLSSLLSTLGNPFRCLALARAGAVESVTCAEILAEFQEKLEQKFRYPPVEAQTAVEQIRAFSRVVTITGTLKVVAADPDDDKVIECALAGGAGYVVTGDRRHLLPLGSYSGIRVVTAAEFVQLVTGGPGAQAP